MKSLSISRTFEKTMREIKRTTYALMETAMMIQEMYDDMYIAQQINPDKVGYCDPYDIRDCMIDWACEFEDKYHDDERYEDDYTGFVREYAEKKITEKFGIDKEDDE